MLKKQNQSLAHANPVAAAIARQKMNSHMLTFNVGIFMKDDGEPAADLLGDLGWLLAIGAELSAQLTPGTTDAKRMTAVRLFGSVAIRHMLAEGGAGFGLHNAKVSSFWTAKVLELESEGWPSAEGLGIRIVEACVDVPDFFSCEMEEVDAGTEGGAA